MSNKRKFDPLQIPPRWLNCPRKAVSLIANKFIAFKVPLKPEFNVNVPPECRFHMSMLIESVKTSLKSKIGLIIDLTNTTRFYDADVEVKQMGIKYVKINCKGHGETPSRENTTLFLNIVENFIRNNPLDSIGVHCTHGFNRSGFLICAYLVEKLDYSVDMAVALFAEARPPGIYKEEYVRELFARYADDPSMVLPPVPELPTWDVEDADLIDDDGEDEDESNRESAVANGNGRGADSENGNNGRQRQKRPRREESKLNPQFAEPTLMGVEACMDPNEVARARQLTQSICEWNGAGFPGAQPVSMDRDNANFLYMKRYMVSWKADGTRKNERYLMLINGRGKIYMLDRDNSVFCVRNLSFPCRKDLDRHLEHTLLDGEFVVDIDPVSQQKIPRFLIYDIVQFEHNEVGKLSFNVRMDCIKMEIVFARTEAMRLGKIERKYEPFSVRQKDFFPINETRKLLSQEFAKKLSHGIDGLIYQPVDEKYKGGRCDSILKWKPPSQNSVDFKLEIVVKEELGGLPEKKGLLFVNGYEMPYSQMKVTRAIRELHGKIIECKWNEEVNQWEFMRERVDKSYPNHVTTAHAVCKSIKEPITEERLTDIIHDIENKRMPPPMMLPPGSSK